MVIQFFFFFFYLLSVVMKQDTPDAVLSHNTVIFEDSTNWIFFSSPYQDLPIMSNSLTTVSLCYLPQPPPSVDENSNCFLEKAKPLEPEAPPRSHCLSSCSVETDIVEIGVVLGLDLPVLCASTFFFNKVGELALARLSVQVCVSSALWWAAGFREERLREVCVCVCIFVYVRSVSCVEYAHICSGFLPTPKQCNYKSPSLSWTRHCCPSALHSVGAWTSSSFLFLPSHLLSTSIWPHSLQSKIWWWDHVPPLLEKLSNFLLNAPAGVLNLDFLLKA